MVRIGGRAFVPREVWNAARPATPVSGSYDEWFRSLLDAAISSRLKGIAEVLEFLDKEDSFDFYHYYITTSLTSKPATPQCSHTVTAFTTDTRYKRMCVTVKVNLHAYTAGIIYCDVEHEGVVIASFSRTAASWATFTLNYDIDPTKDNKFDFFYWVDTGSGLGGHYTGGANIWNRKLGTCSTTETEILNLGTMVLVGTEHLLKGQVWSGATNTLTIKVKGDGITLAEASGITIEEIAEIDFRANKNVTITALASTSDDPAYVSGIRLLKI